MASIERMTTRIREREVRQRLRKHGWTLHPLARHMRSRPEGRSYVVADDRWGLPVFGHPAGASLDAIDSWLTSLTRAPG